MQLLTPRIRFGRHLGTSRDIHMSQCSERFPCFLRDMLLLQAGSADRGTKTLIEGEFNSIRGLTLAVTKADIAVRPPGGVAFTILNYEFAKLRSSFKSSGRSLTIAANTLSKSSAAGTCQNRVPVKVFYYICGPAR